MLESIKHVCILLLIEIACIESYLNTVDSKCAKERPNLFENCDVDYRFMAMWCDHTNFTTLPHPRHHRVKTQTPASMVTSIYLNDSCITKLEPDVLHQYPRIIYFDCEDNELKFVSSQTFKNNSRLQKLMLSRNWISSISDEAFQGLEHLRVLNLSNNYLEGINDNVLSFLINLQILDLSNNQIQRIHKDAFSKLLHLKMLDLSGNLLETPDSQIIFWKLPILRFINLSENNLTNVDDDLFKNNLELESIDLSHNQISYLSRTAFVLNRNLSFLKLNGNKLTTPQSSWVCNVYSNINQNSLIPNKQILSDNPWDCSENLEYKTFLDKIRDENWNHVFDVQCVSPKAVSGKSLSSLPGFAQNGTDGCSIEAIEFPIFHPQMAMFAGGEKFNEPIQTYEVTTEKDFNVTMKAINNQVQIKGLALVLVVIFVAGVALMMVLYRRKNLRKKVSNGFTIIDNVEEKQSLNNQDVVMNSVHSDDCKVISNYANVASSLQVEHEVLPNTFPNIVGNF